MRSELIFLTRVTAGDTQMATDWNWARQIGLMDRLEVQGGSPPVEKTGKLAFCTGELPPLIPIETLSGSTLRVAFERSLKSTGYPF